MADPTLVFAVVAGVITVGFLGEFLFRRTGVPSFLFLIVFGILLGPVFGVFPGQQLLPVLGLFAELTLVMILFYSGLDMKLQSVFQGGLRTLILVSLYVGLATTIVGLVGNLVFKWDIVQSFIFGSIIGGQTATPVVVPLAKSLHLPQETVAIVTLESVINSIVGIVIFLALIGVYSSGSLSIISALFGIAARFSIGIVLGGVLSITWVLVLEKYKEQKYTYVLTVGLLLLTYSVVDIAGGSGELGVFMFGLIFGNYKLLNYIRKRPIDLGLLASSLTKFQDEISFLLNTLFFVFLGLTFRLGAADLLIDLMIAAVLAGALLGSRLVSVQVATYHSAILEDNRVEIFVLSAQGATQATLAIIAYNAGLPLGGLFLTLAAFIIIITNLVTTVGAIWMRRRRRFGFKEFMEGLQENYAASVRERHEQ